MTEEVDPILAGVISRTIKQMCLHHARQNGAMPHTIEMLEKIEAPSTLVTVTEVIFGPLPMRSMTGPQCE